MDPRPPRTLEDPTGRRLRRMRLVGRGIAVVFFLWLAVILLGAIGVGPGGRVLFGNVLRPSAGPPPVTRLPAARGPSRRDLAPALPASGFSSAVAAGQASAGNAASGPAHGGHGSSGKAPGGSGSAPGQTTQTATTPGKSGSAPGHTGTGRGRSGSAPGHQTTTTTSRGHSGSSPGRTKKTTTTTTTTTTTKKHGNPHGKP